MVGSGELDPEGRRAYALPCQLVSSFRADVRRRAASTPDAPTGPMEDGYSPKVSRERVCERSTGRDLTIESAEDDEALFLCRDRSTCGWGRRDDAEDEETAGFLFASRWKRSEEFGESGTREGEGFGVGEGGPKLSRSRCPSR